MKVIIDNAFTCLHIKNSFTKHFNPKTRYFSDRTLLEIKNNKKIQIKKFLLISILFLLTHKKLRDVRYRVKILRNLAPQAKFLVLREKHEIIRQ